jgi:hypothetical protein
VAPHLPEVPGSSCCSVLRAWPRRPRAASETMLVRYATSARCPSCLEWNGRGECRVFALVAIGTAARPTWRR